MHRYTIILYSDGKFSIIWKYPNTFFSHGKVTIIWKYLNIYGEQRTTKFRIIYYTKLSEGTTRWTRRINDRTSNDGEVCTLRWKKRTKAKGGLSRASNPLEDDGFYTRIEFFFSFLFFLPFRLVGDLSTARVSADCFADSSLCPLVEKREIEKAPFNEVTRRQVVGIVARYRFRRP